MYDAIPRVPLNRAKEIVKELYLIGNRQSILWLGQPGIGKSEAIQQIARELADETDKEYVEIKFRYKGGKLLNFASVYEKAIEILQDPDAYFTYMDIRLTEFDPVDLTGVPRDFEIEIGNLKAKLFDYQPFIWQLIASACAGVLNLDEITNIQRIDMRPVTYKILRDRMTGWVEFHPDLLVMAAGNRPEDAAIASMLDAPVINRVRVFNILPPSVEEWAEYMDKYVGDWDRRVFAFLKRFDDYFCQKPPDVETLEPFATPRQWTELAKVSHYFNDDVLEYIAYSNVGSEASAPFITFIRTQIPDVDEVLARPDLIMSFEVNEKYLFAAQLASKLAKDFKDGNKPNMSKYVRVLTWLHQYDRELLQLITVMTGGKTMRKLHMECLKNATLRPIAQFFAETTKMIWEAGV
ncbi:MAG: hypothetical protein ACTSPB_03085 [Candidatus Thorarchaeota archaeon]